LNNKGQRKDLSQEVTSGSATAAKAETCRNGCFQEDNDSINGKPGQEENGGRKMNQEAVMVK
jgi:hypothetical protein